MNKKFHQYQDIVIDLQDKALISPVEGKVMHIGNIDNEEMKTYKKGTPCGYFSIGSSMLLCFPDSLEILVNQGDDVNMGQRILL